MNLSRRGFLKALAGAAVAVALPPTLEENAVEARRIWALDQTMLRPSLSMPDFVRWVEAYELRDNLTYWGGGHGARETLFVIDETSDWTLFGDFSLPETRIQPGPYLVTEFITKIDQWDDYASHIETRIQPMRSVDAYPILR